MRKYKAAIVLSGCGHKDGAEITESVLSAAALSRLGIKHHFFAPDIEFAVVNHLTGETTGERRSVLVEAARIARGEIGHLSNLNAMDYDALVLPGGFGVAKNLSDIAVDKSDPHILLKELVKTFWQEKRPIVAVCISPALVSYCLRGKGVKMTLGIDDADSMIANSGNVHVSCNADECAVDGKHRVVSTPAFMIREPVIADVEKGIGKAMVALLEMLDTQSG
jgi:enhancing lycopene biosynthesis protein 2